MSGPTDPDTDAKQLMSELLSAVHRRCTGGSGHRYWGRHPRNPSNYRKRPRSARRFSPPVIAGRGHIVRSRIVVPSTRPQQLYFRIRILFHLSLVGCVFHTACRGQGYISRLDRLQISNSWSSRSTATLSIPSLGCHSGSSLTAYTGSPFRQRFSCRSTCIPRGASYSFNTLHLPLARHPISDYLQRISRSRPTVDSFREDPCAQTFLLPYSSSQPPQQRSRESS